MFRKSDRCIATLVDNPERLRSAMRELSKRRGVVFWCAMVASFAGILTAFGHREGGIAVAICLPLLWLICFKLDSDLKLLIALECLKKK